jgi:hypothetical protein
MRFDMFSIIIKNIFRLAQLTSSRFNAVTAQPVRPTHQSETPPKPQSSQDRTKEFRTPNAVLSVGVQAIEDVGSQKVDESWVF